ncbi:hypothetical protein CNE_BB1p03910 (plasmid) [Cupriavidus necator N-1]|uniref:Uncharacterized protein n=1 Tax=Cupriavidus necator (strain ATCC 43291 / DSM 13513 / CCUG 52238 / LMG 8453 / N-1) TaxID=1042878 RepID=F8GWU5_CUPNN|nr:hypothetical protein CNE_BB1p03910 [Cupriavidus necator N-1]
MGRPQALAPGCEIFALSAAMHRDNVTRDAEQIRLEEIQVVTQAPVPVYVL